MQGVPGETIADGLAQTRPSPQGSQTGSDHPGTGRERRRAKDSIRHVISRKNLDRNACAKIHAAHVRMFFSAACNRASGNGRGLSSIASIRFITALADQASRSALSRSLLEGVASDADLIQDDGEHPNEQRHPSYGRSNATGRRKRSGSMNRRAFIAVSGLTPVDPSWRLVHLSRPCSLGAARWRSGHAEDCKSLHAGSIPARASKISLTVDRKGGIRARCVCYMQRLGRPSQVAAQSAIPG